MTTPYAGSTGGPLEITGLGSARAYAAGMQQAMTVAAAQADGYAAGLVGRGVRGPAVQAVVRAHELTTAAAAAWAAAGAALDRQTIVKEAYTVTPEAGNKQFVTETTAPGAGPTSGAPAPRPSSPAKPAPQPAPAAGAPEMIRVNYIVRDENGNWVDHGDIEVNRKMAPKDDLTLSAALTAHLHQLGAVPRTCRAVVSSRSTDQAAKSWVHYVLMRGYDQIGVGDIEVDLTQMPADDAGLSASITAWLRRTGGIAPDQHAIVRSRRPVPAT